MKYFELLLKFFDHFFKKKTIFTIKNYAYEIYLLIYSFSADF